MSTLELAIKDARDVVAAAATEPIPSAELRALAASPFGQCVLGLAGYLEATLAEMQAFVTTVDSSEEQCEQMAEKLLVFADVVNDEDNAIFTARIGTHPVLMRLMEHENELIQDAAAQIVANCMACIVTPVGISFPHRSRQLGPVDRAYPLVVPLPVDPRDGTVNAAPLSVLIRQVPVRMTGQPKTGYLLWGAARVLARWIHSHRELFDGKSVLEVGSGLGLGGIIAARYAAQTILTDYQDDTCRALEYNVALNHPFTHALDATKPEVQVEALDWDSLESIKGASDCRKPKVDVIIGCDIICEPSTADGFLRVVRHRLSAHGVAYLMNADAHSRFGVAYLHEQLAKSELVYTITKVDALADGAVLLDTVADSKELRYEYYEIRLPPGASSIPTI